MGVGTVSIPRADAGDIMLLLYSHEAGDDFAEELHELIANVLESALEGA